MDSSNQALVEREEQRIKNQLDDLVERIAQAIHEDGAVERAEGFLLFRESSPTEPRHGLSRLALCLIVQGRKEVTLGDDLYFYDANQYLITAAALPIESRITEATKERPCLGMVLDLDPAIVGSVIIEATHPSQQDQTPTRAFNVSPLDEGLLNALIRLIGLQDEPADEARFLHPLVIREIIFRLFKGEQGGWLRHTAVKGSHSHGIAVALERLQKDFDQPLQIEELAQGVGMSVSSFHHHFKAVTAMSPMQFQKRMRMHEARRLMLYENFDAASAGFHVGYEDASYFSREYKRHFGQPPRRDVQRLRAADMALGVEV